MSSSLGLERRWISPSMGYGVFTTRPFKKGEVVLVDRGRILSRGEYLRLPPELQYLTYQVAEKQVLAPLDMMSPSYEWYVNHSCEPNTGYGGELRWVALRNIAAGEEITHDYATLWTSDIQPYEVAPCLCGSKKCRSKFTADDWMIPELQKRYKKFWPDYIRKKMRQKVPEPVQ